MNKARVGRIVASSSLLSLAMTSAELSDVSPWFWIGVPVLTGAGVMVGQDATVRTVQQAIELARRQPPSHQQPGWH